ncbi:hypothetical protein J5837_14675 [Pseudoxanthomonas helianthi]|uniref:DUF1579 domain-containing protein n=1 Tax=Pseudoxanthomonas helianthi TaxID=1453541 RepID=A0A940X8J6_9GAMM|nr:hypothetical protein [Pseudoxanthomonas helianthi]
MRGDIGLFRVFTGAALAAALALPLAGHGSEAAKAATERDGRHDFDWEIGTWKTELRRLVRPLSGSNEWAEYTGTTVVRKVLDGAANLVELRVQGPAGRIEGASLRLYNPQARQWGLHYASMRSGAFTRPVFGAFDHGRGEFYGTEVMDDGREVMVRFVITATSADSAQFEQAYSADGGKHWEVNWLATDTRVRP